MIAWSKAKHIQRFKEMQMIAEQVRIICVYSWD